MSSTYPLTGYGLMAKRHWMEFCPRMVKELEAQGKLEEALYEAQETTSAEMMELRNKLQKQQNLTPQQAYDQAWEVIREKYIYLRPEETAV
ncbi:MAG TPA: hypothetical protein VHC44_02940 [Verrucomicrobiae bacterium]|nr:hypothetical protein [Verrucomicrobiae bacterium]